MCAEFDQGRSASAAARNIRNTYGVGTMSDSNRPKWFVRFKGVSDGSVSAGSLRFTNHDSKQNRRARLESVNSWLGIICLDCCNNLPLSQPSSTRNGSEVCEKVGETQ